MCWHIHFLKITHTCSFFDYHRNVGRLWFYAWLLCQNYCYNWHSLCFTAFVISVIIGTNEHLIVAQQNLQKICFTYCDNYVQVKKVTLCQNNLTKNTLWKIYFLNVFLDKTKLLKSLPDKMELFLAGFEISALEDIKSHDLAICWLVTIW